MSVSSAIRDALIAGERISVDGAIQYYGGGPTTLSQQVAALRKQGYKVDKERNEGVNYYFVKKRKQKAKSIVEETTEFPVLPNLLDELQVAALKVDRKGRIGMTLRSAKHSWHVTVEGIANK